MIALVLALILTGGLATAQSDTPTVALSDLDAVKASYAAANYDDALKQIGAIDSERLTAPLEQYRALSLMALGRSREAEQAFERLVRRSPLYRMTEADVSPRIATMFLAVRRRVLPAVAREMYARGKSDYDQRHFAEAAVELKQLLAVLDDPDLAGQPTGTDDLKQLAEGFVRLAELENAMAVRAAAPTVPILPGPAPDPSEPAAVVTKIIVYSAADTNVTPPVELVRRMPPWAPTPVIARSAEYRGDLEIVVNEIGAVESAVMNRSTVPTYDLVLLEAARRWRFKPAMLDGQAVKYRLIYSVTLSPRR